MRKNKTRNGGLSASAWFYETSFHQPQPAETHKGLVLSERDAMTREIAYGRSDAGTVSGPLFDSQMTIGEEK